MAERKTYTAEDFKGCNGRRVLVEGVLANCNPDRDGDLVVLFPTAFNPEHGKCIHPSAIVEILPEEIVEGDCVVFGISTPAKVLAIRDGRAWVEYEDGRRDDWPVSHLTLVERGQ